MAPATDDLLDLVDYRRRVAELYQQVRSLGAGRSAWEAWRAGRDELFREHPQSPYDAASRRTLQPLPCFDHDPAWRTTASLVRTGEPETFTLQHSAEGGTTATRVGVLRFQLGGERFELSAFWLEQYGGGLFVPFRDATSGDGTYGGGRYLLDTAKGADLGGDGDGLVVDFNYAYHPSCVHSPRWSCPLALPEDRLPLPVRAGERLAPT